MNPFKKSAIRIITSLRVAIWTIRRTFHAPALPINADGKTYLNLGSGSNSSPEFTNVDARKLPAVHHIHDIQHLPMIRTGSVDLIYASHVVEHIPRKELVSTLSEWHRALKPGGVLRIGVPDFDSLIEIYQLKGRNVHVVENQLLGQDAPYDDHHTIWNMAFAEEVFKAAGFSTVRKWDTKTADHHSFADKTNRVEIIGGKSIPISLNIEGTK